MIIKADLHKAVLRMWKLYVHRYGLLSPVLFYMERQFCGIVISMSDLLKNEIMIYNKTWYEYCVSIGGLILVLHNSLSSTLLIISD
jgi:hypothetical protein